VIVPAGREAAVLRHALELPALYHAWSRIYLPAVARAIQAVTGDAAGLKVLDLGCGTGQLKEYFPQADFTGIDCNARYIAYAQKNYGGRFFAGDVLDLCRYVDPSGFDCIILAGILHHIDSARALVLMNILGDTIKPGGRVIAVDHVNTPALGLLNKLLLWCDRGAFFRDAAGYAELFNIFRLCSQEAFAVRMGPVTLCSSLTRYVLQRP